ncbi:hypothetical protein AB0D33_30755 [Streptomyces sp. NPDC048404]|uniref:hypothetical protein n=1 Tax=unclassified Streptomyces TaxID=2593676 RepID=UPI00342A4BF8
MAGFIAAGVTMAVCIAGDRGAKKRKKAFWDAYGSFEGFRDQVDAERIQGVRTARGDIAGIKAVRRDHTPGTPQRVARDG